MTKPKGIGRGNNSASHDNRKIGDKPISDRLDARLLPHQKQTALELGNGNASDGVRKALDICSRDYHVENPTKLVVLLTMAQTSAEPIKSELIAEALDYLESWSIERLYSEAIAEGVIKTKGSAYIT
ncbi:MAG TPA: hypothetical protein V6D19_05505 [Stenomitos sp.]